MEHPSTILIINGSLGGAHGNTARMAALLTPSLGTADVRTHHLASGGEPSKDLLSWADGFVFCTGVYWDSWWSPLQRFFELVTSLEGDACWFGKPAALLVSMHSVGGKEVLGRLQGVLNTFGLYVPPMSAMAFSLANQTALSSPDMGIDFEKDLWCLDDLNVLAKNLGLAVQTRKTLKPDWARWPVDHADAKRIWLANESS